MLLTRKEDKYMNEEQAERLIQAVAGLAYQLEALNNSLAPLGAEAARRQVLGPQA